MKRLQIKLDEDAQVERVYSLKAASIKYAYTKLFEDVRSQSKSNEVSEILSESKVNFIFKADMLWNEMLADSDQAGLYIGNPYVRRNKNGDLEYEKLDALLKEFSEKLLRSYGAAKKEVNAAIVKRNLAVDLTLFADLELNEANCYQKPSASPSKVAGVAEQAGVTVTRSADNFIKFNTVNSTKNDPYLSELQVKSELDSFLSEQEQVVSKRMQRLGLDVGAQEMFKGDVGGLNSTDRYLYSALTFQNDELMKQGADQQDYRLSLERFALFVSFMRQPGQVVESGTDTKISQVATKFIANMVAKIAAEKNRNLRMTKGEFSLVATLNKNLKAFTFDEKEPEKALLHFQRLFNDARNETLYDKKKQGSREVDLACFLSDAASFVDTLILASPAAAVQSDARASEGIQEEVGSKSDPLRSDIIHALVAQTEKQLRRIQRRIVRRDGGAFGRGKKDQQKLKNIEQFIDEVCHSESEFVKNYIADDAKNIKDFLVQLKAATIDLPAVDAAKKSGQLKSVSLEQVLATHTGIPLFKIKATNRFMLFSHKGVNAACGNYAHTRVLTQEEKRGWEVRCNKLLEPFTRLVGKQSDEKLSGTKKQLYLKKQETYHRFYKLLQRRLCNVNSREDIANQLQAFQLDACKDKTLLMNTRNRARDGKNITTIRLIKSITKSLVKAIETDCEAEQVEQAQKALRNNRS